MIESLQSFHPSVFLFRAACNSYYHVEENLLYAPTTALHSQSLQKQRKQWLKIDLHRIQSFCFHVFDGFFSTSVHFDLPIEGLMLL